MRITHLEAQCSLKKASVGHEGQHICHKLRIADPMCGKLYRSAEADLPGLPFWMYSIDVVVNIRCIRYEEKRSTDKILLSLTEREIRISRTECNTLTHVFKELITIRPVKFDPDCYDLVIGNGGFILTIDGVQPEKGNSVPYVLRDSLTPKVCKRLPVQFIVG